MQLFQDFVSVEPLLNVQLPCKNVGLSTPDGFRVYIKGETPVLVNLILFYDLTVSKMASVFVASLHPFTRAATTLQTPKQTKTASLGFACQPVEIKVKTGNDRSLTYRLCGTPQKMTKMRFARTGVSPCISALHV